MYWFSIRHWNHQSRFHTVFVSCTKLWPGCLCCLVTGYPCRGGEMTNHAMSSINIITNLARLQSSFKAWMRDKTLPSQVLLKPIRLVVTMQAKESWQDTNQLSLFIKHAGDRFNFTSQPCHFTSQPLSSVPSTLCLLIHAQPPCCRSMTMLSCLSSVMHRWFYARCFYLIRPFVYARVCMTASMGLWSTDLPAIMSFTYLRSLVCE